MHMCPQALPGLQRALRYAQGRRSSSFTSGIHAAASHGESLALNTHRYVQSPPASLTAAGCRCGLGHVCSAQRRAPAGATSGSTRLMSEGIREGSVHEH